MSRASYAYKLALIPIAASLLLVSVAPAAFATNPGPPNLVGFAGSFTTPDGRQFGIIAVLTPPDPCVSGTSCSLAGGAVVVEKDPGPQNRIILGTFSVTGTLTQTSDPATGSQLWTFTFVLINPGPINRQSLTSGTSFNAVFKDPGPTSFVWTTPDGLSGTGGGFVTVNPGPQN